MDARTRNSIDLPNLAKEPFVVRRSFITVVVFGLVLAACSADGSPAPVQPEAAIVSARGLPLGDFTISTDGQPPLSLEVEIADTPEATRAGLMGVAHLPELQGMVFLSPTGTSSTPFWMKDTLIPLDIAFWDAEGQVFDIQQMQPCAAPDASCPRYQPSGEWTGALEVNLGLLERNGVREGAHVTLERR
jgi:uncharacterized membrane protein (UPF0127 family)